MGKKNPGEGKSKAGKKEKKNETAMKMFKLVAVNLMQLLKRWDWQTESQKAGILKPVLGKYVELYKHLRDKRQEIDREVDEFAGHLLRKHGIATLDQECEAARLATEQEKKRVLQELDALNLLVLEGDDEVEVKKEIMEFARRVGLMDVLFPKKEEEEKELSVIVEDPDLAGLAGTARPE